MMSDRDPQVLISLPQIGHDPLGLTNHVPRCPETNLSLSSEALEVIICGVDPIPCLFNLHHLDYLNPSPFTNFSDPFFARCNRGLVLPTITPEQDFHVAQARRRKEATACQG